MTYFFTDRLGEHLRDVDIVTSALGVTMPKPYRDLRQRWEDSATGESYADQYVAALVSGDTKADLPLLRNMAIAVASTLPKDVAQIDNYLNVTEERKLLDLSDTETP